MGHSSSTNYTISSSLTTEQNGDSIVNGLLPSNVILTIIPNAGFAVSSENFTISNFTPTNTTTVGSGSSQFISYFFHNTSSPLLPSGTTGVNTLPPEVDHVVLVNTVAGSPVGDPSNNILVYVYFANGFVMPSYDLVLNIDIDGKPSLAQSINYPASFEIWTSFISSDYTISPVVGPNLINSSLNNLTFINTQKTDVSGFVDDGVQTLLLTQTFATVSGFHFVSISEIEQFTNYGLADWLPYFDVITTNQTFNNNGQEISRTIEVYYTNPPLGGTLDPNWGGNAFLGHLYEYQIQTNEDTKGEGISPLSTKLPLNSIVSNESSAELGGEVENVNPALISKKDTTFFKSIYNVTTPSYSINGAGGDSRAIVVRGDVGAAYSIKIVEGSNTYDSSSDTFTSSATQIDAEVGDDGTKVHDIIFPQVTSTKSYAATISSRFGTKMPANISDGVAGNIVTLSSEATRVLKISFTFAFTDATCDYNNDPTIAHDDDSGKIEAGMSVTGTGIPSGATVASVTGDTAFELSASTTGGNVANGTLTFNEVAETMPSDITFSFVELPLPKTWKVEVNGDVGQTFAIVDTKNNSEAIVTAMAVASGSASGWVWEMSNFRIVSNGINAETNKPNISMGGDLNVSTVGAADVEYAVALDTLINVN